MSKFENFLNRNKNIIQFFGIITALITLVFTCNNTRQTKKSIDLSYKQYEELVSPIWQISLENKTNDVDYETVKFVSNNSSIVLNSVDIYYSFNENLDSAIVLTPINWNTNYFKTQIINDIKKYYEGDQFVYTFYSCIPVCLNFSYYQHGILKSIKTFYKVNFQVFLRNETVKLSLKSFEFIKNISTIENSQIINELEEFNYYYCYKSCCEEMYIHKVKTKIIQKDEYLNEILNYSKIFQKFRRVFVVVQSDTTLNNKIIYPEFIFTDSLLTEIKSRQDFIVKKRKHFPKSVYMGFLNLKKYLDTTKYPDKNELNQIIETNWNKERKDTLIKFNQAMIDSLYSSVKIQ